MVIVSDQLTFQTLDEILPNKEGHFSAQSSASLRGCCSRRTRLVSTRTLRPISPQQPATTKGNAMRKLQFTVPVPTFPRSRAKVSSAGRKVRSTTSNVANKVKPNLKVEVVPANAVQVVKTK